MPESDSYDWEAEAELYLPPKNDPKVKEKFKYLRKLGLTVKEAWATARRWAFKAPTNQAWVEKAQNREDDNRHNSAQGSDWLKSQKK